MTKFVSLLLLFGFGNVVISKGQAPPPPPPNLLPTITTPSPEVSAFARFGNYEVNLFNGTPDISIPLYEINVGDLKLPVSINYNASGIRVNDVPSNIGTGWSLSAGGTITRKVMGGVPDEYSVSPANTGYFGYLNGNTAQNTLNFDPGSTLGLQYLRDIADNHRIDAEPDIFSYSIPGKSGKFIFSQQDGLRPFFIPYQPIVVTPTITSSTSMLFAMTDESGVNYQFNAYEMSLNSGQILPTAIISSWLLTRMGSPNGHDSINFSYSNGPTLNQTFPNDNLTVIDQVWNDVANGINQYTPTPNSPTFGQPSLALNTYSSIVQENLDSINFRNGKIVFQLAPESRLDLALTGLKKRMQKILVYNLQGSVYTLIKEIDFYHSYFIRYAAYTGTYDSTTSRRLRLDSLVIKDGSGASVQRYAFGYNSRTDNYGLPDQNAKCIDYWGYYNAKFATSLVPRTDINYTPTIGAPAQIVSLGASVYGTRNPDSAFMQADILNKITYPAGGYTTFVYEANQYSSTNLPANAVVSGGLRIKQMNSYDGISLVPVTKTYVYGQNESGYGLQNFTLNNYFFFTTQSRRYWYIPSGTASYVQGATESIRTYLANPTMDIEPWDAVPVAYPYVTEYIGNGFNNTGKTVYQFNTTSDIISYNAFIGSTFILSNHFHRGQVLFKTVYRKNSDNSYSAVTQAENHYAAFPDSSRLYNALSVTHNIYTDGATVNGIGTLDASLPPANSSGGSQLNGTDEYVLFNYAVQSGDNRLTEKIDRSYDQNNPSNVETTTTNFYYDNFKHMQPTRIVTTNSKGQLIIDTLKYEHEFAQAGNVYQSMVNSNVINKVVQDNKTNNSTPTNLRITNYANWGSNNFLPQTIQMQIGTNPIETRANFLAYDQRGNPQQMQKTNDMMLSYIWDYNNVYPIATVNNASLSDIAFSSFEADGTGNWSFSGTPVADITSPTGGKCYNLSTGAISKSGLTSTNSYIISYWIKGTTTPLSITGTQTGYPVKGKTINGWTYFEHLVTGQTAVTVSGSNYIDELRLYPSKAQMTTYTFSPLIGMTSACDADNRVTYYFYDAFGRLKWAKDQDGNMTKAIQYHYQGIPGAQY